MKVGLGLAGFLRVSARVGGYICILLLTCLMVVGAGVVFVGAGVVVVGTAVVGLE